jgi:hypothetical protein
MDTESRSGGTDIHADEVNVGGDVVGRDKVTVAPGGVHVGEGGSFRQTIVNLPRGVQLAVVVSAAATVAIAGALLTTGTASAKIDFEEGTLEKYEIKGNVELVSTGADAPELVGHFATQLSSGAAFENPSPIRVPDKQPNQVPVLTIMFRSPPGVTARGTLAILFNDTVVCRITDIGSTAEWQTHTCDIGNYASTDIRLRVEYVSVAGRVGGLSRAAILQAGDAVWIDNIEFTQADSEAIALVTPSPSPSPTWTPSPTATATRTPRPAPTDRPRPTTEAPAARVTSSPAPVTASIAITQPLTFTWSTGAFRQSGTNDAGQGIWAQAITVVPSGGAPPYTVVFGAAGQQAGLSFEVFGLFCVGQVGRLTVQAADSQTVSEVITIQAPLCPTKTPTPTSTPTRTPTWTPTSTPTPTPAEQPLAALPVSDGYLVTINGIDIQGQGRRAQVSPGGSVTVNVNYFISDPGCPGCIDQILIGIADDVTFNEPMGCVYNGSPGASGVMGIGSLTFNVPTTPGVYFVRFHYGQDFGCAFGWWGVGGEPGSAWNLGTIIVP